MRSDALDVFVVSTINRRRGDPPGFEPGTGPASVTTIVTLPSRKVCPKSAVFGFTGTFCTVEDVVAAVVDDTPEPAPRPLPPPLHAARNSAMPTPSVDAATREGQLVVGGAVVLIIEPIVQRKRKNDCGFSAWSYPVAWA